MTLGDLVLQNFFGIVASVIASVLGYVALRFLRGIRASTNRTEEHAKETAEKVSQLDLDKVSLTAHNRQLEQWQQDMALRIEAAADYTSDSLAWQATFDRTLALTIRRVAALEEFALSLDTYAHGGTTLPTYTAPVHTTDLVGAPDDQ
jgi:hypothetical protein